MQNEGLQSEVKEKTELLNIEVEKNLVLEKEKKDLAERVKKLDQEKQDLLKEKEGEIEKLKRELDLLRAQLSTVTHESRDETSAATHNIDIESPKTKMTASTNVFDQI